jgi:hypothetical protein
MLCCADARTAGLPQVKQQMMCFLILSFLLIRARDYTMKIKKSKEKPKIVNVITFNFLKGYIRERGRA